VESNTRPRIVASFGDCEQATEAQTEIANNPKSPMSVSFRAQHFATRLACQHRRVSSDAMTNRKYPTDPLDFCFIVLLHWVSCSPPLSRNFCADHIVRLTEGSAENRAIQPIEIEFIQT
jgi:hypothetical protein